MIFTTVNNRYLYCGDYSADVDPVYWNLSCFKSGEVARWITSKYGDVDYLMMDIITNV